MKILRRIFAVLVGAALLMGIAAASSVSSSNVYFMAVNAVETFMSIYSVRVLGDSTAGLTLMAALAANVSDPLKAAERFGDEPHDLSPRAAPVGSAGVVSIIIKQAVGKFSDARFQNRQPADPAVKHAYADDAARLLFPFPHGTIPKILKFFCDKRQKTVYKQCILC